jgi:ubiquinone/menaquinone biosynthesis C-methylase UbiE/DNA-binding XRE family transcriptional regulator
MINKIETGNRIAAIRVRLGYTQTKFAELLGVSTQAVSKWETGLSLPNTEVLLNISWMSKTTMNSILDGSEFISEMNGIDRGLARVSKFLLCPSCKENLKFSCGLEGKLSAKCGSGHHYDVIDGVLYFDTREIPGELWSLWLKNYDHYLQEQRHPGLQRYMEGEITYKEVMWREIDKLRPSTIVDFACGTGSGIKYIIEKIRWPVTIILADLSHRILKYNRTFFSGEWSNPYVDIVYLACDCAAVPLLDDSVDMVFSNGGFESMQHKMIDGFHEAYRILKPGGHAVYNISIVGDHSSENTIKWIKLYEKTCSDCNFQAENLNDINQWIEKCKEIGFTENRSIHIYDEMPAPDNDVFPFENQIMRWMAADVMLSEK